MHLKLITAIFLMTELIQETSSLPLLSEAVRVRDLHLNTSDQNNEFSETKSLINPEDFLRYGENVKPDESLIHLRLLDVFPKVKKYGAVMTAKRIKRHFIGSNGSSIKCPSDKKPFRDQCITPERYEELMNEE